MGATSVGECFAELLCEQRGDLQYKLYEAFQSKDNPFRLTDEKKAPWYERGLGMKLTVGKYLTRPIGEHRRVHPAIQAMDGAPPELCRV